MNKLTTSQTVFIHGSNFGIYYDMPKEPMKFWLDALNRTYGVRPHFTKKYEKVSLECPSERCAEFIQTLHEDLHGFHGEPVFLHTDDYGIPVREYSIYVSDAGWEVLCNTVSEFMSFYPQNFGFVYDAPNYSEYCTYNHISM